MYLLIFDKPKKDNDLQEVITVDWLLLHLFSITNDEDCGHQSIPLDNSAL